MRDNILHSMKRGGVTMAILADFLKAFDTVAYKTVLKKMHKVGFSKSYLRWITSSLTERKQFVQIDDKLSSTIEVAFGVPLGSILRPVIFNLYVNDLSDSLEASVTSHQYADDTTIYAHSKPANIKQSEDQLQHDLNQLSTWSKVRGQTKSNVPALQVWGFCIGLTTLSCKKSFCYGNSNV